MLEVTESSELGVATGTGTRVACFVGIWGPFDIPAAVADHSTICWLPFVASCWLILPFAPVGF